MNNAATRDAVSLEQIIARAKETIADTKAGSGTPHDARWALLMSQALLALSARCQQLEEGLREALDIAWRRGGDDVSPADSDTMAECRKLLEAK